MVLRPDISLAARTANTGEAFSNALLNVQRLQGIQQQPLRNRLLEAQTTQVGAQTSQVETNVTKGQQLNNIRSLAIFANSISGDILNNDLSAIRQKTVRRISQGLTTEASQDLLTNVLDNPNLTDEQKLIEVNRLSQNLIGFAQRSGALQAPGGSGGLASAKTEILSDGSVIQALPNGEVQVRNPQGQIVTGDERAAVLRQSRQSGLDIKKLESGISVFEARGKAEATQRASRVSQITSELSTRNRESKRTAIRLNRALNLAGKATQGLTGAVKLKLSRLVPDLDVSDEASLEQSLKLLALDQLQKFKGPTTDFEFRVTEDIAGKLGDSRSANIARIKSLQRAEWFNQREFEQFIEHTKAGKSPDTFGFNFNEQIKTKKGSFSLQDIQDTAVDQNLTIEETIKRLNQ